MQFILRWIAAMISVETLIPLVKRLAVLLGVSVVSYVGFGAMIDAGISSLSANYGGLTEDMLAVLAIGKIPDALNVILSAFASRLTLMGLTSAGVLKQILWRPGQTGSLFP